jgi:hypothetical protein
MNETGIPTQTDLESVKKDESVVQLGELVLDHLGIPRPSANKHIQELQDELLPKFLETARLAWMASAPHHQNHRQMTLFITRCSMPPSYAQQISINYKQSLKN